MKSYFKEFWRRKTFEFLNSYYIIFVAQAYFLERLVEMNRETWKTVNVTLLGLGFMFCFTAFFTASNIAKYVTSSLKIEEKNSTEFKTGVCHIDSQ